MKRILNFVLFVFLHLNAINALPQVRVQPATAILPSSSEARLLCESKDTPFLSVAYWTHVGQRIQLNPSIIEMDGNELRLYQFGDTAYTQPGAYACVVQTEYGLLESEPAMLSLPTLDSFKSNRPENHQLNITEGNIAVIQCELPNGNPRPISIFTHDHQPLPIESQPNRYRVSPHGHLHIIDVKPSDVGLYQCFAQNPVTGQIVNNSQTTTLHVLNKPLNSKERPPLTTVYKPPVASRVLAGHNFSIDCVIAGWPKPIVEWEKYGDVLPDKRHEVIDGTLYLHDVRLDDRGTYICRASNVHGHSDIAYTALLEVLEPPKVLHRPDSVIQLNRGESLSIKCAFRGRPEPVISWLYNGEEININGSPVSGVVLSLNQPKTGIYQCIGRNPYGVAQASTILMLPNNTKTAKTEDIETDQLLKRSLIVIGPNNITVYEGETIQLHCLTQPGSSVQWLHNGDVINMNLLRRYEMLPSGGLRIVSAQRSDSGIYECLASKIGFGTSTAKCFVQIQDKQNPSSSSLASSLPNRAGNKLEIVDIHQISNQAVEILWKIEDPEDTQVQIQYRLPHTRATWTTDRQLYNQSITSAIVSELRPDETYRFRLLAFDSTGQHISTSSVKRLALQVMNNLPVPQITDAWITTDGQVSLKWKLNDSTAANIDGFIIYYRSLNLKHNNFTKIMVPHIRYPLIDTYTISVIESDNKYELRMATYSKDDTSAMSNAIEISIPSFSNQRRSQVKQKTNLNNFDEILDNITKIQSPNQIVHDFGSPAVPLQNSPNQKSSDILYLTIGIIAGILMILVIILIVMCLLRIFQRKKFIAHVKSVNGSEYYCDGLHKNLNPDYATTPCLQHGVVSVDGKLIPFAYPTNPKQALLWHGQSILPHSSTTMTTTENGTMRVNPNPLNRIDSENNAENQENFYHTLTPFANQSQYPEHETRPCPFNATGLYGYSSEHTNVSSCPVHHHHHHLMNYPVDSLTLKTSLHAKDNGSNKNSHGIILASQNHILPCAHFHHHGTSQRYQKSKRIPTPVVNENDQQQDSSDRSFSSSSAGVGHYCTHSSNDSTRPLMESQKSDDHTNENYKHAAPASTGSSSHSSSGISSAMESPYNHWKYLTPLSVATDETAPFLSDNAHVSSKMVEPVSITSS